MTAARAFATVGLGLAIVGPVGTAMVRYGASAPFIAVGFGFGVEVDIPTVATDLRSTVDRAVSPSSVVLWIREARA